jgi:ABC-type glycerol-3-phosphate transport system substrate-binding protein
MKFTQKQISIIGGGVLLVFIIIGALYFGLRPSSQNQKVTLTVWGTDPSNVFEDLASAYKTADPGATINYTQIDPANYDQTLLEAFAAGTGPDLFEIGNRELPKWQSVTAPIPATLSSSFNLSTLQNDFPTVIGQDFVSNNEIYALPLDLDTLAMYYNKDIFDSAGIVYPPTNWNDFETDIGKLRIVNAQGQITRAAAAIGGSEASITNAPDLVFLLMLQNGTQMISQDGTVATFNGSGSNSDGGAADSNGSSSGDPGLDAFNFYLQFANSASPYYTWNDAMGDAVQSFAAGNTAILFDYASAMATIKAQQPFLNFGVAAMPQPASSTIAVNYPEYTGLAVSHQGQIAAAWQFILFATTNPAGEAVYTKDTGEPPATRAYIASNLTDPTYGVFAAQALTARSWYEADDEQIDSIMNGAIQSVLNGSTDSAHALGTAQDSVSSVMAAANQ